MGIDSDTLYIFGRYIVYVILMCLVVIQSWKKRSLYLAFIVMALIIISILSGGAKVILSVYLFCIAAQVEKDSDKIVRAYLNANVFVLMLTVFGALTGLIDNDLFHRGVIQRNALGFSHPNGFAGIVAVILISYYYLHWMELESRHYFISLCILGLVWVISNSKTQLIVMFMLVLMAWLLHKANILNKYVIMKNISYAILIVSLLTVVWAIFGLNVNNALAYNIDEFFSFRFSAIRAAYDNAGLTLFGTSALSNAMLDNSYAWILFNNGIIALVLYTLLWVYAINDAYKNREERLLLSIVLFLLIGMIENSLFRMECNFVPVVIANHLWGGKRLSLRGIQYECKNTIADGEKV